MAVSWSETVFPKMGCWDPYFIVFFGCALFGPSCQKRDILDTHQKIKNWLITEKHLFCIFVFLCFFSFFFFFCCFIFVFFWGFKGQVRWPKGAPHLALNHPYSFVLFLFCFSCVFFSFFGGFKGQVRWPEGPPHLALNPPYLLFLFFWGGGVSSFPFFAS